MISSFSPNRPARLSRADGTCPACPPQLAMGLQRSCLWFSTQYERPTERKIGYLSLQSKGVGLVVLRRSLTLLPCSVRGGSWCVLGRVGVKVFAVALRCGKRSVFPFNIFVCHFPHQKKLFVSTLYL